MRCLFPLFYRCCPPALPRQLCLCPLSSSWFPALRTHLGCTHPLCSHLFYHSASTMSALTPLPVSFHGACIVQASSVLSHYNCGPRFWHHPACLSLSCLYCHVFMELPRVVLKVITCCAGQPWGRDVQAPRGTRGMHQGCNEPGTGKDLGGRRRRSPSKVQCAATVLWQPC